MITAAIGSWLLSKFGKVGAVIAEALAALAVLCLIVFAIHHDGATSAEAKCQAADQHQEAQRSEAVTAVTETRATTAISAIAADVVAQGGIQTRAQARAREVIRYVQAPPAAVASCALDDAGMRLWTSANADGAPSTDPAGTAGGGLPGPAAADRPDAAGAAGEPPGRGDAVPPVRPAPARSGELGAAPGVK